MKYARINDAYFVVETLTVAPGMSIDEYLHPEVASQFMPCPDNVDVGCQYLGSDQWKIITPEVVPATPTATPAPRVTPPEFKLLFMPAERVQMRLARPTDPAIDDFFDIIDDPRLTFVDLGLESVQQALAYLESKSILTADRVAEILQGKVK